MDEFLFSLSEKRKIYTQLKPLNTEQYSDYLFKFEKKLLFQFNSGGF